MANVIEVIIAGKDEASKVLGAIGSSVTKFGVVAAAGAAVATAAFVGVGLAVTKMTLDAAAVEGTRNTFKSLAEDIGSTAGVMTEELRRATRGMVEDAGLWAASNKFVAMGITETAEQTAEMAEMATQLGMAMGEKATPSMENFALMMANQSIPRLDSFGISSARVRERMKDLTKEVGASGMSQEKYDKQVTKSTKKITKLKNQLHLMGIKQSEWTDKTKESTKVAHKQRIDEITWQLEQEEAALKNVESMTVGVTNAVVAMTREEAFRIAVLEEGRIAMERVGEQGDTYAAIMDRITATIANTMRGIGEAFLPILGILATKFEGLVDEWGPKVVEWAELAGEWLGVKLPKAIDWLGKTWGDLKIGDLIDEIATAIEGGWPAIWEMLKGWGTKFWKWVPEIAIPKLVEEWGKMTTAAVIWVGENWPAIAEALKGWGKRFWGWTTKAAVPGAKIELDKLALSVIEWAESEVTQANFAAAGEAAGRGFARGLQALFSVEFWKQFRTDVSPDMETSLKELGKTAIDAFIAGMLEQFGIRLSPLGTKMTEMLSVALLDGMPEVMSQMSAYIADGLKEAGWGADKAYGEMEASHYLHTQTLLGNWRAYSDELVGHSIIPDMLNRMVAVVVRKYHSLRSAGRHIMSGLRAGVVSGMWEVREAIIRAVRDAIAGAKAALGIWSPSTVFEGFGAMTMQGLAEGIKNSARLAEEEAKKVLSGVQGLAGGGLAFGGLTPAGVGAGAGGGVTTISIVNYFGPDSVRADEDILDIADAITQELELRGIGPVL